MSFSVRNTGLLRRLAVACSYAPRRIREDAAGKLTEKYAELVDAGFDAAADPYGKAWKPPADAANKPLQRSGKLRAGFKFKVVPTASGLSVSVSNTQAYAIWVQRGTDRMEARMMLPGKELPESWKKAAREVYAEATRRWYESAGG